MVAISSLGSPLEVTSAACEPDVFRIVRDETVSDDRRIVFRLLNGDKSEIDFRKPIIVRFEVNHSQRIEVPVYTSFMLPVNEEQHNQQAAGLPE